MPVIYADVLVALNWLIDYLLLSAVAVALRIPHLPWRRVVSALLGGVYSCVIFLPPLPSWLRIVADTAVAGVMVLTAFSFQKTGQFLKRTAVLFLISALFSGVVTALTQWLAGEWVLIGNGQLYAAISPLHLAIFALISYGALRLYERLTRKHLTSSGEYRVRVEDGGGVCEGRALHDTGLHLREPFSGAAVILMERTALQPCLSVELNTALSQAGGERVRMIPYRTVSGNGLLPAFRPRRVRVWRNGGKERDVTGVYVALTESLGRGEYQALIGNDLTE